MITAQNLILPNANDTISLGTNAKGWSSVYLGGNSATLGLTASGTVTSTYSLQFPNAPASQAAMQVSSAGAVTYQVPNNVQVTTTGQFSAIVGNVTQVLQLTITPARATSKFRLYGSGLLVCSNVGDVAAYYVYSSATSSFIAGGTNYGLASTSSLSFTQCSFTYIDSPATASPVTYTLYVTDAGVTLSAIAGAATNQAVTVFSAEEIFS
jgi:hypothetical protein